MQVDGEACRLNPATIELSFLNQVTLHQFEVYLIIYSKIGMLIDLTFKQSGCYDGENERS